MLVSNWNTFVQLRVALGRLRGRARRGRVLRSAFPSLGLEVGDRLEPSPEVPDYLVLESLRELPSGGLRLTFWRGALQTRCRHRNPLFCEEVGVYPSTMTFDALHCLFLGVFQHLCAYAMRALIRENVFDAPVGFDSLARIKQALARFVARLKQWYTEWEHSHPAQTITRIQDVTPKMLGTAARPSLKLKGAETKYVMFFLPRPLPHARCRV